jgi:hypothetical protein
VLYEVLTMDAVFTLALMRRACTLEPLGFGDHSRRCSLTDSQRPAPLGYSGSPAAETRRHRFRRLPLRP